MSDHEDSRLDIQSFELPAKGGDDRGASGERLYLAPLRVEGREAERGAVREILERYLGSEACLEYQESGRPFLRGIGCPYISISHTKGWAALLVSPDCPCGVDIERVDRDASRVAGRVATEEELSLARSYFPENPELLVWCVKEAAFKAAAERRDLDFRNEILFLSDHRVQVGGHRMVEFIFWVDRERGLLVVTCDEK